MVNKIIELQLLQSIKDSYYNIKFLNTRITLYKNLISDLESNKPLFFQKKKIIEYDNKLNEYKNKVNELNEQLVEEEILLYKMYESK